MKYQEARDIVTQYTSVRKEARKALLVELRRLDEIELNNYTPANQMTLLSSERRKLFSYPSDIIDSRLLSMLERFEKKGLSNHGPSSNQNQE